MKSTASHAIKTLWHKAGRHDSLKTFAKALAKNKENRDHEVAQSWLSHKQPQKKVANLKIKKIRKGKGTWEGREA